MKMFLPPSNKYFVSKMDDTRFDVLLLILIKSWMCNNSCTCRCSNHGQHRALSSGCRKGLHSRTLQGWSSKICVGCWAAWHKDAARGFCHRQQCCSMGFRVPTCPRHRLSTVPAPPVALLVEYRCGDNRSGKETEIRCGK